MIKPYKNDINLTPCTLSTIEKTIEQSAMLKQSCYTPLYLVKGEINNGVYINYHNYLPPTFVSQKCVLTNKLCVVPKVYSHWIDYYKIAEFDPYSPFNDIDVLHVKSYDAKSDWAQVFIVISIIKP